MLFARFPVLLLAVLSAPLNAWTLQGQEYAFTPINNHVHVMHGPLGVPSLANQGFMNNPGFVTTDTGVVLIDPGSSLHVGRKILEEMQKITNRPVLAVFNSHIHGDHWLGNQAVRERYPDAPIYGQASMIDQANDSPGVNWLNLMLTLTEGASEGTRVSAPDQAVVDGQVIEIDGHHFRIHAPTPAHTNTDIMVEHVESRTVFLGDNGFNQRMGRFDSSGSIMGTIDALATISSGDITWFVPGHGDSGPADRVVAPYLSYLRKLNSKVAAGYEEGLADYEIKELVAADFEDMSSWSGFDEQFGPNINKMFLEIEEADF